MKYLSNTYDPNAANAFYKVTRAYDETQVEAWQHRLEWLKGKIIGEPQATKTYTVKQLKAMNMVGIYLP
jgi:hypothetical protein